MLLLVWCVFGIFFFGDGFLCMSVRKCVFDGALVCFKDSVCEMEDPVRKVLWICKDWFFSSSFDVRRFDGCSFYVDDVDDYVACVQVESKVVLF